MKKLIDLSKSHYVIVDSSKIEEDDWVLPIDSKPYQLKKVIDKLPSDKKITHSSEPLEEFTDNEGIRRIGWTKIKPLSPAEVEEAIYRYNAVTSCKKWLHAKGLKENSIAFTPYVEGFMAHQELVKDKLYTVEDMNGFIDYLYSHKYKDGYGDFKVFADLMKRYIQSIPFPTEWDCDIIEGKLLIL